MAEAQEVTSNQEVDKVLRLLSLQEYFPGKISRIKMYEVTEESLSDLQPSKVEDVGWYFLRKIISYNYQARSFQLKLNTDPKSAQPKRAVYQRRNRERETNDSVHPLDVIVTVFLCLDPICQQDLIMHMWACRLAVPFLIPIGNSFHAYLWPIRAIVMRWESLSGTGANTFECRIVDHPMEGIGFIRFSQTALSKSELMNDVIADSEKAHPIFFHRKLSGSIKNKIAANGLIELGWYFPKGTQRDHFKDCKRFANLHGDSRNHPEVLGVLSLMSSILVIICKSNDLQEETSLALVERLLSKKKTVVVMVTDERVTEETDSVIEGFVGRFSRGDDENMTVITAEDKQKAELVRETKNVLKSFQTDVLTSLSDISEEMASQGIHVDEDSGVFKTSKQEAQKIVDLVCKENPEGRKNRLVPMQGEHWRSWSKADKAVHRIKEKSPSEDIENYLAKQEEIKRSSRDEQFKKIKDGLPKHIAFFINAISRSEDESVHFFLRWLKHLFDDTSRKELSPKYKEYSKHMSDLADADETKRKRINKELETLDVAMSQISFGLEHLIRELAQIYEALASVPAAERNRVFAKEFEILPLVAAQFLLNGYPLEIMDGDVSAVPLTWVKTVLEFLVEFLRKKEQRDKIKILALSVLGIQSSGKSTFLNTLFGLQFAVSAGRCTRGVYMQLVKIESKLTERLGIDYIVAIDTEGLRSPELSSDSGRAHDNELSTFVIGLGDFTIINLMGENTTYLGEFLPISVHAFLRMESVGLHPKCAIVHQNVDRSNKDKLLQQGRILENILNDLTSVACKFENLEEKQFKEIIAFDISSDIYHMPALLEGTQPMSPISTDYSEEAINVKNMLLFDEGVTSGQNSLEVFPKHVELLWNAIKKDDFVYEFKNTIETQARGRLDKEWCSWSWEFRQAMKKFEMKAHKMIMNCNKIDEVNETVSFLLTETVAVISTEYNKHLTCLKTFFENPDKIYEQAFLKWKDDTEISFQSLKDGLSRECEQKIRDTCDDKKRNLEIQNDHGKYEGEINGFIKKFVEEEKAKIGTKKLTLSEENLQSVFEDQWKLWLSDIVQRYPRQQQPDPMEADLFQALMETFRTHQNLVMEKIKLIKSLASYDFADFEVNPSHFTTMQQLKRVFSGPDPQEFAMEIAQSVKTEVRRVLETVHKKLEPYNAGIWATILQIIIDKSQERVTQQFKVDLAVAACWHAIKKLQTVRKRLDIENDPKTIMNKSKEKYFRSFTRCFDQTNVLGSISADLVEGICEKTTDQLEVEIASEIVNRIKTKSETYVNVLNSKESFLLHLMKKMAKAKNFYNFYRYINWPKKVMKETLLADVEAYCSSREQNKNKTVLESIIESKVKSLFQAVQTTVDDTEQSIGRTEAELKTWKETFRKKARETFIIPDLSFMDMVKLQKFDVASLSGEIKKQLDKERKNLLSKLEVTVLTDAKRYYEESVHQIFMDIIGCTEVCPFCREICKWALVGHAGNHECVQHRPIGCTGGQHERTKEIWWDTCNYCVYGDSSFRHPDELGIPEAERKRVVRWRELDTVFPKWKIIGDASLEVGSFWKCFFVTYLDDLLKKHRLKTSQTIPSSWYGLNMETEIEKLN